ncbi:MAG: hypothetical protein U9Q38_01435 [Thermodesulfobacteriota bacterium]|nr:hypothetical protein [Thermodesulfobacteriota bacterium]
MGNVLKLDRGLTKPWWDFNYYEDFRGLGKGFYHETAKGTIYRLKWYDALAEFRIGKLRKNGTEWELATHLLKPKAVLTPSGKWRWGRSKLY